MNDHEFNELVERIGETVHEALRRGDSLDDIAAEFGLPLDVLGPVEQAWRQRHLADWLKRSRDE